MITAFTACEFNWNERSFCYNTRLSYTLHRSGKANELLDYIYSMHYMLFDADSVLIQVSDTTGTGVAYKDLDLAPGEYTMVTWGNLENSHHAEKLVPGETRMDELHLDNTGNGNNTEKLYFSSRTFTVKAGTQNTENIEMTHSHALFHIIVKWTDFYPPLADDWSLQMRNIPARYSHLIGKQIEDYPQTNTRAETSSGKLIYTIPEVQEERFSDHTTQAYNHPKGYVYGDLCTFRHTNNTHQLVSLWKGDEQQMKEIDLNRFFNTMNIDLDKNLRQEFNLTFTIRGTEVGVVLTEANDWIDGGDVGD